MVARFEEWIVTISQQAIKPAGQSGNPPAAIARIKRQT